MIAVLAAAIASAVRSPWVVVTSPWIGFSRDLASGTQDVFWDPVARSWAIRVSRPEAEGESVAVPGEWWDALRVAEAQP